MPRYEWEFRTMSKPPMSGGGSLGLGNVLDGPSVSDMIEDMEWKGFSVYHIREGDRDFSVLFRRVVDSESVRVWFLQYRNSLGGLFNVGPFSSREEACDAYMSLAKRSAIPSEYSRCDVIRRIVSPEACKRFSEKAKGGRFSRLEGAGEVVDFGVGDYRRYESVLKDSPSSDSATVIGIDFGEGPSYSVQVDTSGVFGYPSIDWALGEVQRDSLVGELGNDSLVGGDSCFDGVDEDVFDFDFALLEEDGVEPESSESHEERDRRLIDMLSMGIRPLR